MNPPAANGKFPFAQGIEQPQLFRHRPRGEVAAQGAFAFQDLFQVKAHRSSPRNWRSFPRLQLPTRVLQLRCEHFFIRQRGEVFADEHLGGQGVGGVAHEGFAFATAKNNTHGRILAWLHPVLAGVVQVHAFARHRRG